MIERHLSHFGVYPDSCPMRIEFFDESSSDIQSFHACYNSEIDIALLGMATLPKSHISFDDFCPSVLSQSTHNNPPLILFLGVSGISVSRVYRVLEEVPVQEVGLLKNQILIDDVTCQPGDSGSSVAKYDENRLALVGVVHMVSEGVTLCNNLSTFYVKIDDLHFTDPLDLATSDIGFFVPSIDHLPQDIRSACQNVPFDHLHQDDDDTDNTARDAESDLSAFDSD